MDRAKRKLDHIKHALQIGHSNAESFDDIRYIHQSMPEISLQDVTLFTSIGELKLSSPIFINAMTGGGGKGTEGINAQLAELANQLQIPMAVGSQMAAIKDKNERKSFEIVRKYHPKGHVFSNIGSEASSDQAKVCIEMIEADALQIHLNVIQELVMPEGDRDFSSTLKRIEDICSTVHVPVIVKEVGFGMNRETVQKLKGVGVSAIDIGGFGGTNFSKIENKRRKNEHILFDDWGIPTAISICEAKSVSGTTPIIASGGVRNALDLAKSISLGAESVGLAGIVLQWLTEGNIEEVIEKIQHMLEELKFIMTALGASSINELQEAPLLILGTTGEWLNERNIDTRKYANRTVF